MARLQQTTARDGTARYRVRFRVNGRSAERWFTRERDAAADKTRVEAEALDGILVDPRAGARTLDAYFTAWLESRLVRNRPLTPATRIGYKRLYRRNIQQQLGSRLLRTFRPETIRTCHAEVSAAASADQAAKRYRRHARRTSSTVVATIGGVARSSALPDSMRPFSLLGAGSGSVGSGCEPGRSPLRSSCRAAREMASRHSVRVVEPVMPRR